MIMTVEITMYPFTEEFIPPIKSFIDKLNDYANVQVDTFPTCTVLVGEYDVVMDIVRDAIAWSHRELGKSVFITKFIPGYQAD
jgi:uncharacterized protein YqgV (UPF0045/DUF77 family)